MTGRAGAGKTAHVLSKVAQATEALQKTILLVPEQFTFSAERIITRSVKSGGLLFTQVLSPSWMAYRVLTMIGGMKYRRLDASGMAMAVKKSLIEAADGMRYFNRSKNIADVAPLMTQMIVKLKQNGISPEGLMEMLNAAENVPQTIRKKIEDIALVFGEYESSTEEEYADEQRQEQLLIDNLSRADFLREYDIYVDGFDVIAPLTLKMIATLATVAKSVTVTFTCGESGARDYALFSPVRDTVNRLTAMLRELTDDGESLSLVIKEIESSGFRSPEIGHLEKELFAENPVPYDEKTEAIKFFYAPSIEREAVSVASNIIHFARDNGIKYGEMAVISADDGSRGEELQRQLEIRGVPCRMDLVESAADHSAVKLIISALLCANRNLLDRKDVFAVLKSGWIGIDDDAADIFENYVIEHNLFASRFFTGLDDEALENTREKLVDPIRLLLRMIKPSDSMQRTAQTYSKAVYEYISRVGLLSALVDAGEGQLAQIICDVLDQSYALLGEMNIRDYVNTLREGFAACRLGSIPHRSDCVSIGSLVRFKGDQIKALFVMGMNDGLIPSGSYAASLLSDDDIQLMGESGKAFEMMGTGKKRQRDTENLSIYGAFTQAYDYLYLSLARNNDDGVALDVSPLMIKLGRLFPNAETKTQEYFYSSDALLVERESTKKMLGLMLRKSADMRWQRVREYFHESEPLFAERFEKAFGHLAQVRPLGSASAKKLFFGEKANPSVSISRIEAFAMCPYKHFLTYGIRPVIRKTPEIRPLDRGSFFHDFLEEFTHNVLVRDLDAMGEKYILQAIDSIAREQIDKIKQLPAAETPMGRAAIFAMDREVRRAAENIAKHVRQSGFKPENAEIKFGQGERFPAIELEAGGMTMLLEGRIDRLDTAVVGGEKYARVVDYKSGNKALLFQDIVSGTGLQLVTYLKAVQGGGFRPAGAFYLHVAQDMKTVDPNVIKDREKRAADIKAGYRLEGISTGDMDVLQAMSGGGPTKEMLNVTVNKNGTIDKRTPVYDSGQMKKLTDYVTEKERDLVSDIARGDIEMRPIRTGSGENAMTPCAYCDHFAACMFDSTLGSGYRYCDKDSKHARELILGGDGDGGQ